MLRPWDDPVEYSSTFCPCFPVRPCCIGEIINSRLRAYLAMSMGQTVPIFFGSTKLVMFERKLYFYSFFSSFIPKYFHPAMNEIICINLRLSQWVKGGMCELRSCLATFTFLPGFYWWIYQLVHGAGTVAEEILQYYQHYQPVFSPWQGPRGVE
jgi:hypothetical protein